VQLVKKKSYFVLTPIGARYREIPPSRNSRRTGSRGCTRAEPPFVVIKRLNDQGAKRLRHLSGIMGQPVWGGTHDSSKVFDLAKALVGEASGSPIFRLLADRMARGWRGGIWSAWEPAFHEDSYGIRQDVWFSLRCPQLLNE
jgi:hypothetical protein